jgi:hypothetical protein
MPKAQLINGEWMKVCTKPTCHMAGTPQPIERFNKDKTKPDGRDPRCKECCKTKNKEYYQQNRERTLKQQREYHQQNREKLREYHKEHYQRNKEKIRKRKKEYNSRPENKKRRTQRIMERYHSDPAFRLKDNVSRHVHRALKARGKTKGGSTFDHLPYTPQELKEHIEKQFDEHMTWENHGSYWHVDHIKPHASFDYDNLTHPDFQKCWALENLRPLKAIENIRKSSIYEGKRHYHNKD